MWINLAGILLIALIVWWFWLSKPKIARASSQSIEITVDNGVYTPSRIEVPVGQEVTLVFVRKDPSPCAEQVVFRDFNLSYTLPINSKTAIKLTPSQTGEFEFTCQMQMYRGSLVVK